MNNYKKTNNSEFSKKNNNIFYSNNDCFRNASLNEKSEIINTQEQKLITPFSSQNNKNRNCNNSISNNFNGKIERNINNINNMNNYRYHNINKNISSEVNNQSKENEVESLMSTKKYNTMIMKSKSKKRSNMHKKRQNLFTILKNVFKDFLNENEEEKNNNKNSENEIKFNLRRRPILTRIIEKDIISPFQNPNTLRNREINNNVNLRHTNVHIYERPELFSDDISLNISEKNDEDEDTYTKLISYIPVFNCKDKKKEKENNNKCIICLSDFEIGDKKSTLPCLHFFHPDCIERWIKRQKYCPICKFQISFESLLNCLEEK